MCNGLSGQAFGLCNAYCEAEDCDVNPKQSCERLRKNYEIITGSPVFPCDIPPSCKELNPTQEQIDAAVAEAISDIDNPWGKIGDFQLLLDRIEIKLRCYLLEPADAASAQTLPKVRQCVEK